MSCRFANLDASYVLGSLAPAERADYERHLSGCEECARAVRELAGLPGLLARVPADVLDPGAGHEPVPASLLPALVAAAERQQRRRTTRTALLTAAAVAVIAVGSAIVAASVGDDEEAPVTSPPPVVETTAPPQRMTPVGDSSSKGWVSLTPLASGETRVDLTCVYRSSHGGSRAYPYTVDIYSTTGLTEQVMEFPARSGKQVQETGTTSFDLDEIEKVVVEGSYGPILLLTPARTP